ncbi:MAG TPA: YraN family protein [Gelria sp.]|jgi:putative endonuclease|nr:YraN family protein [Gelria sp.]
MKRKLGIWGEGIAARYLQDKGYKILDRNYYTRNGELDIICEKDGKLVFVEVKTRKSTKFGSPEEAITRKKINHLRQAALIYLKTVERPYQEIRFDVIAILIDGNKKTINHIEQAF